MADEVMLPVPLPRLLDWVFHMRKTIHFVDLAPPVATQLQLTAVAARSRPRRKRHRRLRWIHCVDVDTVVITVQLVNDFMDVPVTHLVAHRVRDIMEVAMLRRWLTSLKISWISCLRQVCDFMEIMFVPQLAVQTVHDFMECVPVPLLVEQTECDFMDVVWAPHVVEQTVSDIMD
eukprot:3199194-Amphidinium_carterae.1